MATIRSSNLIDMTNEKRGRLLIISRAENDKRGEARWNCICDCGNSATVLGSHLRGGASTSCGCRTSEVVSMRQREKPTIPGHTTHGHSKHRLYTTWSNMKTRCLNPRNRAYKWYGARGIAICEEWYDFMNFYHWAIDNGYSDNLTIDRIDPDGNYEPTNCRWVTIEEQQGNRRDTRNATNV